MYKLIYLPCFLPVPLGVSAEPRKLCLVICCLIEIRARSLGDTWSPLVKFTSSTGMAVMLACTDLDVYEIGRRILWPEPKCNESLSQKQFSCQKCCFQKWLMREIQISSWYKKKVKELNSSRKKWLKSCSTVEWGFVFLMCSSILCYFITFIAEVLTCI